ncbi:hypothetical protein D1871_08820 [Nakamurella silvestris]|nr:hypothetical protein D1871_08820 [Nakamurella silvestris]
MGHWIDTTLGRVGFVTALAASGALVCFVISAVLTFPMALGGSDSTQGQQAQNWTVLATGGGVLVGLLAAWLLLRRLDRS